MKSKDIQYVKVNIRGPNIDPCGTPFRGLGLFLLDLTHALTHSCAVNLYMILIYSDPADLSAGVSAAGH